MNSENRLHLDNLGLTTVVVRVVEVVNEVSVLHVEDPTGVTVLGFNSDCTLVVGVAVRTKCLNEVDVVVLNNGFHPRGSKLLSSAEESGARVGRTDATSVDVSAKISFSSGSNESGSRESSKSECFEVHGWFREVGWYSPDKTNINGLEVSVHPLARCLQTCNTQKQGSMPSTPAKAPMIAL